MFFMSFELVARLDELAAYAWSPGLVEPLDGWRLRYHAGVTRRANSVWPRDDGGAIPIFEKLARVEEFYRDRGLPVLYQLSPASKPAELDSLLEELDYAREAPTLVQAADLTVVAGRTGIASGLQVSVEEALSEPWFVAYHEIVAGGSQGEARRELIQRIPARPGFAVALVEGQPATVAIGVLQEEWVGVFAMATHWAYRRQGAATAVLHGLANWGRGYGAQRIYLQVMEENAPARAAYARAGFETVYSYHYRMGPEPDLPDLPPPQTTGAP
jgi:GNAT superfamily N-acetyltransferase